MRAWVFSLVLLSALFQVATAAGGPVDSDKQVYRIEHATPEILQQVTRTGVDVAMVRGLGSAKDWQPRGMAEIDLWLTADELRQLRAMGLNPVAIPDEAREMRRQQLEQPQRDRDYHNHAQLTTLLQAYAAAYPSICRLSSIGQSVQGRDLWVMKISDNPDADEDEPEFKYIGTMHGNEPLGCEMILYLLDDLLTDYGTDPRITALVNGMEIHLLPLMNPDGNMMVQRTNANGVDLNRNFPDPWSSPNNTPVGRQPETAAVMLWTQSKDFDLSANFHTGALLVNYPFDNNASGSSVYTASPDDDLFIQMSLSYSINNPPMYNGDFPNGISNGADWYAMSGGMQDWNYRWEGGMEVTIELSDTYWPDAGTLPTYWANNRESMLTYMEWAWRGVRGICTNAVTGQPLAGVEVRVTGRDYATWSAAGVGDYHRLLPAGTYTLTFSKAGYQNATLTNVTVGTGAATVQDVALQPLVVAPDLALGTVTVVDGGNGRLDPGETASLSIPLTNVGTTTATALTGTLTTANPWVTVTSGPQEYGSLLPDQSATASYSVSVDPAAPEGSSVAFTMTAVCAELTESLPFALNVGLVGEDFETGNFFAWPWVMGGNGPWTISALSPPEGSYCARSGNIGHSQTSAMSLNLDFLTAGTVQFHARVSSESNYDFLRFSIDGVVQASWSGEQAWATYSFPITAGTHLISWTFAKDGSISNGLDAAFVDWIVLPATAPYPLADILVTPAEVAATLSPGSSTTEQIVIQNIGSGTLNWSAQLALDNPVAGLIDLKLPKGVEDRRSVPATRNAGGPDTYGYTWADSREPGGPTYSWVEISTVGTALASADDANVGPFNLGFTMPFYGNVYSSVRISTNGFLSFTATESAYSNTGIPNASAPNNLLAAFWDDLDPTRGGTIYYWDDPSADRFIVQWNAVRHYTGTGTETFQVILSPDGTVLYQYRIVNASQSNNCTVGIENATGTDGLQCVMNAGGFLVNNLAIRFLPPALTPPWAAISPLAGSVAPGSSSSLDVALSAEDLQDGLYTGTITLSCNDPETPTRVVPLILTVSSQVNPVSDLSVSVSGGQVLLSWTAVPQATGYRIYRSEQPYSGYTLVGTSTTPGWSAVAPADDRGCFRVTATR